MLEIEQKMMIAQQKRLELLQRHELNRFYKEEYITPGPGHYNLQQSYENDPNEGNEERNANENFKRKGSAVNNYIYILV